MQPKINSLSNQDMGCLSIEVKIHSLQYLHQLEKMSYFIPMIGSVIKLLFLKNNICIVNIKKILTI